MKKVLLYIGYVILIPLFLTIFLRISSMLYGFIGIYMGFFLSLIAINCTEIYLAKDHKKTWRWVTLTILILGSLLYISYYGFMSGFYS